MHSAALLFFELFELFDAEDWRDVESDQRPPQVQVRNSRERTGRPDLLLLLLTGGGGSAPPKKLPGSTAQQIVMANAIRMLSISTSCFRRLSPSTMFARVRQINDRHCLYHRAIDPDDLPQLHRPRRWLEVQLLLANLLPHSIAFCPTPISEQRSPARGEGPRFAQRAIEKWRHGSLAGLGNGL